jgi:hypothetical protein
VDANDSFPPGFRELNSFSIIEALLGRRSRRFFRGAEIPDGVFAFKSKHDQLPLSELEKLLILTVCSGNTSWHNLIYRAKRYAPHISNYAAAACGRTFPSAAGFHTSNLFFTDDTGVYFFDTRDLPASVEKDDEGNLDLETLLFESNKHIRKIENDRLSFPSVVPQSIYRHITLTLNSMITSISPGHIYIRMKII